MKAVRFVVEGLVQGVYYRVYTMEMATELGLQGYVANLADGNVEVFAQGSEDQIERLEERLRKGPPMSKVTTVRRFDENEKECETFSIKH